MNSLARSLAPRITVLCLGAALASCGEQQPLSAPPVARPLFEISDGTHAPGNPGFFFLPPIAQLQTWTGVFDDTLAPVVTICALQAGTCGATIATFTRAAPPSRGADDDDRCDDDDASVRSDLLNPDGRLDRACEDDDARLRQDGERWPTVRLNRRAQHYVVRWYTHRYHLDPAVTYRITVAVGALPLGYADVDVVRNRRAAAAVDTSRFVPLLLDRTLPIKFRIEVGALGTLFCPGTAGAYSSLQAAVNAAPDGGTVLVCDGTHSVEDVNVSHAVTITSAGPGVATLDAGSAGGALWIGGGTTPLAGTVVLRNLRFVGGQWDNVSVTSNAGSVLVSHCTFENPLATPGEPEPSLTALVLTGSGNTSLTVDQSTFIGADVGVGVSVPSGAVVVSGNTFRGQANSGVHVGGPTPGLVTVQGNSFSDCGPNWCLFTQVALAAIGNTFTIDMTHPTHSPLRLDVGVGGSDAAVATDNVVNGLGAGAAGRADPLGYPMQVGIQVYGTADLRRNQISNAYDGVWLSSATVTGSDNVITGTFAPLDGSGTITMNRNDLLDYVNWRTFSGSGVDLRCNYWGSSLGPAGITNADIAYLPYATQLIANQPGVICTP